MTAKRRKEIAKKAACVLNGIHDILKVIFGRMDVQRFGNAYLSELRSDRAIVRLAVRAALRNTRQAMPAPPTRL
jgi:hypothetical protein